MKDATMVLENGEKINYQIDDSDFFQYVITAEELAKLKTYVVARENAIKERKKGNYKSIPIDNIVSGYLAEKLVEYAVKSKFPDKNINVECIGHLEEEFDIIIHYKTKIVGRIQMKSKVLDKDIDYELVTKGKADPDDITFSIGDETRHNHLISAYDTNTDFLGFMIMSNTLNSSNLATSSGFSAFSDLSSVDIRKARNNGLRYCYYPTKNMYKDLLEKIKKNITQIDKK